MDDVRVVRRRSYVWPVVIAIVVLALIIAWALFGLGTDVGPRDEFGWLLPEGTLPVAAALPRV